MEDSFGWPIRPFVLRSRSVSRRRLFTMELKQPAGSVGSAVESSCSWGAPVRTSSPLGSDDTRPQLPLSESELHEALRARSGRQPGPETSLRRAGREDRGTAVGGIVSQRRGSELPPRGERAGGEGSCRWQGLHRREESGERRTDTRCHRHHCPG